MVRYYWHLHDKARKFAFARVLENANVDFIFDEDYPDSEVDAAEDWFLNAQDALAVCSTYEWELLEEDASDEGFHQYFRRATGHHFAEVRDRVIGLFNRVAPISPSEVYANEAARTGSPSGRAGSGEPPASAAG